MQRRVSAKNSRQIELSDVRVRDEFDHGEKMQPLRGRFNLSTEQLEPVETSGRLFGRRETDQQHDNRQTDV